MKTIVIWDELDANIKFFVLEGDYSHLDKVYINQMYLEHDEADAEDYENLKAELYDLVYDSDGFFKLNVYSHFPGQELPIEGYANVITAGFIP